MDKFYDMLQKLNSISFDDEHYYFYKNGKWLCRSQVDMLFASGAHYCVMTNHCTFDNCKSLARVYYQNGLACFDTVYALFKSGKQRIYNGYADLSSPIVQKLYKSIVRYTMSEKAICNFVDNYNTIEIVNGYIDSENFTHYISKYRCLQY